MSWNHMRVEVNENMRIGFFDGTQDTGLLKANRQPPQLKRSTGNTKNGKPRGACAGYGRIKPSFHAGVGA